MKQYTERQTVKISKIQKETLAKLDSYGINVSQFIRLAIKEKLRKDWKIIKERRVKNNCPF